MEELLVSNRVLISSEDGVAHVRLNRADKLNALDPAMFEAIAAAIAQLQGDSSVRAAVLSGEGRAFCAGLDMQSMAGGGSGGDLLARSHGHANLYQQVAWGWRTLPVPVIAAVHGVTFGGGLQIVSGADIRIAHPEARMSIMEAKWGLVPDMAGIALWRSLVRDDLLRELTYTHREFSGTEAQALGFATRLSDDPLAEALKLARVIASKSPHAVRGAKRLYNLAADGDAAAILHAESVEQKALIRSPNQTEAVLANVQKRAAKFED
jgi:enoyl-CoA hydratase/carnithine racemase